MKIKCLKCKTEYNVSTDNIPDKGATAKCKKCGNKIIILPSSGDKRQTGAIVHSQNQAPGQEKTGNSHSLSGSSKESKTHKVQVTNKPKKKRKIIYNKRSQIIKRTFTISKTNTIIHGIIAGGWVLLILYFAIKFEGDAVDPIVNLLGIYSLTFIITYIAWRLASKSNRVANITFNIAFIFVIIFGIFGTHLSNNMMVNQTLNHNTNTSGARLNTEEKLVFWDDKYEITKPKAWKKLDIEDEAQIQIGNLSNDAFLFIFTEDKQDFISEMTLNMHSNAAREVIASAIENTQISDPEKISLNGMRGLKCIITGVKEDFKVKYWLISLEADNEYHLIIALSPLSTFQKYLNDYKTVFNSFKETIS